LQQEKSHLTETNFECYFFAGIIVEIKTKGVKTFFPKASPMGSKLNSRSLRSTH